MKILIATTMTPETADNARTIHNAIAAAVEDAGIKLVGATWVKGPGCNNFGIALEGAEAACESLANYLTMAMMPARWTTTSDPIDAGLDYFGTRLI